MTRKHETETSMAYGAALGLSIVQLAPVSPQQLLIGFMLLGLAFEWHAARTERESE